MAKGFMTPKEMRPERNVTCTGFHDTMAWAVANRPGANPVNGGRSRRIANFRAAAYRMHLEKARKHNKRMKLSRYTPPRPDQAES